MSQAGADTAFVYRVTINTRQQRAAMKTKAAVAAQRKDIDTSKRDLGDLERVPIEFSRKSVKKS